MLKKSYVAYITLVLLNIVLITFPGFMYNSFMLFFLEVIGLIPTVIITILPYFLLNLILLKFRKFKFSTYRFPLISIVIACILTLVSPPIFVFSYTMSLQYWGIENQIEEMGSVAGLPQFMGLWFMTYAFNLLLISAVYLMAWRSRFNSQPIS
jgi:hypothetical protein